ncbi:MAG: GNAT family N-acetyltransferase [Candidatus Izemoplasmatales bacterium]|nr:GNAT family N-acetyltransferase [Candidatus Izemoplasmatales bacterium]
MPRISLKRITNKNFNEVVKLSDTLSDYQKKCVAPNVVSLAQAYVNKKKAWPRAIYLGKMLIGFIMLALWDEDIPKEDWPAYYVWRFMIAKNYQKQGFGTKVLDIIKEKCIKDNIKSLYISCEMDGNQPYDFYIKYGFVDTGINDGEQILKMYL